MANSYSIAEARNHLPKLVHEAEAGAPVEITRRGRTVAVLLSAHAYQDLIDSTPSLWQGICELRAEYKVAQLDGDGAFDDLRDGSPGRDIDL